MDNRELYEKLTDAFIIYQHRLDNPFPTRTETPAVMQLRYNNDPVFHNRVQSLVNGVMNIVCQCAKIDPIEKENKDFILQFGEYSMKSINVGNTIIWLENKSGEGMGVCSKAFESLIDNYFRENY